MQPVVVAYLVYIAVSIGLTVSVARVLRQNGAVFLVDVFRGNEDVARAVNTLLVVGFYLLNLGYAALTLRIAGVVPDSRVAIEALSRRLGGVLLVLGALHLANVFVLNTMRRRRAAELRPRPPVAPTMWMPPPADPQQAR